MKISLLETKTLLEFSQHFVWSLQCWAGWNACFQTCRLFFIIIKDKMRDRAFKDTPFMTHQALAEVIAELGTQYARTLTDTESAAYQVQQTFERHLSGVSARASEITEEIAHAEREEEVPVNASGVIPPCQACHQGHLVPRMIDMVHVNAEIYSHVPLFFTMLHVCNGCGLNHIPVHASHYQKDLNFGLAIKALKSGHKKPEDHIVKKIFQALALNGGLQHWLAGIAYVIEDERVDKELRDDLSALHACLKKGKSYSYHFKDGEAIFFPNPGATSSEFNIILPNNEESIGWAVGNDNALTAFQQTVQRAANVFNSAEISSPEVRNTAEWSVHIDSSLITDYQNQELPEPFMSRLNTLEQVLRERDLLSAGIPFIDWLVDHIDHRVDAVIETQRIITNDSSAPVYMSPVELTFTPGYRSRIEMTPDGNRIIR